MARAFTCIQVLFYWAARLSVWKMGRVFICAPLLQFGALVVGGAKMARAFTCIQVLFNWAARLSAVKMGRAYLYARYHHVQNQLRGVKGWKFGAQK